MMMRFGHRFVAGAALALAALTAVVGCQPAPAAPAQAASAPVLNNNRNSTQAVAPAAAAQPASAAVNMGQAAKPAGPEVAKVDLAAMQQRIQAKDASYLLLDARQPNEWAAGRVPTAVNVPASELVAKMASLPKDKEIIVYCYGRGCSISRSVALKLQESGFPNVKELDGGVGEWQTAGYQLEK